jgi:hypothetical protein
LSSHTDCNGECLYLSKKYFLLSKVTFSIGILLISIKAIVAAYLLKYMKGHLYFFYRQKRRGIITSVILGVICVIWNVAYWLIPQLRAHDFVYIFTDREKETEDWKVPILVAVSLFDVFMPTLVIVFNIYTINFQKYIHNLLKGCEISSYVTTCSIFIKPRRRKSINSRNQNQTYDISKTIDTSLTSKYILKNAPSYTNTTDSE